MVIETDGMPTIVSNGRNSQTYDLHNIVQELPNKPKKRAKELVKRFAKIDDAKQITYAVIQYLHCLNGEYEQTANDLWTEAARKIDNIRDGFIADYGLTHDDLKAKRYFHKGTPMSVNPERIIQINEQAFSAARMYHAICEGITRYDVMRDQLEQKRRDLDEMVANGRAADVRTDAAEQQNTSYPKIRHKSAFKNALDIL